MTKKAVRRPGRPRPTIDDRFDLLFKYLRHHFTRLDAHLGVIRMALSEMTATLAKIDTATDNIAADIKGLKDKIGTGMSDADVAAVQAALDKAASKLEGIAADTADPVPGA